MEQLGSCVIAGFIPGLDTAEGKKDIAMAASTGPSLSEFAGIYTG